VFAIEASRLARNGRDWHTLIEFCGLVGTLRSATAGHERAQGCARAPQRRSVNEGSAAGLAPRVPLFATRSPMRLRRVSQIGEEISCRLHQWSKDAWAL